MLNFGVSYSVQGTPLVKSLATVVAMGPGLPADVERLEEEGFDSKMYLEDKVPTFQEIEVFLKDWRYQLHLQVFDPPCRAASRETCTLKC